MFQRLVQSPHGNAAQHYGAFYSSILGGITNEPGLMVLHADDHMVHRGHGVYDIVTLVGGTLYQLDEHVDRLVSAAEAVGITLPMSVAAIKRIILDTAAASMKLNGEYPVQHAAWHGVNAHVHGKDTRAGRGGCCGRQCTVFFTLCTAHTPEPHPLAQHPSAPFLSSLF